MQITHEIREYIISDGGNKYSVRHNVMEDVYSIKQIVLNESQWDRNSMVYFDVTEDFLNRVKDAINKLETNGKKYKLWKRKLKKI